MISVMPFFRRAKILRKRHKRAEGCLKKTGVSKLTGGTQLELWRRGMKPDFCVLAKENKNGYNAKRWNIRDKF